MDEATKWALAQGGLGVYGLMATLVAVYFFRENRTLYQQMLTKSATDAEVNKKTARDYHELLDAIVNKTRARGGRRATVAPDE